jgi:cobalt-zinc-cadmium resistance protein CzcA
MATPGESRLKVIYRAVRRSGTVPVASGIAIIVMVFLPLLTLEGLEGKLFVPVALTDRLRAAGSLVLSLTVMPVLSSFLMLRGACTATLARAQGAARSTRRCWMRALARPASSAVAGAGHAGARRRRRYLGTGKTFMPTMDEGDIMVQLEKLPSISWTRAGDIDLRCSARSCAGARGKGHRGAHRCRRAGLDPMGLNQTDVFLVLKPREQWQAATRTRSSNRIRR